MYYVPYLKSGPFQKFQFLPTLSTTYLPRYIIVHVGCTVGTLCFLNPFLSFPFLSFPFLVRR